MAFLVIKWLASALLSIWLLCSSVINWSPYGKKEMPFVPIAAMLFCGLFGLISTGILPSDFAAFDLPSFQANGEASQTKYSTSQYSDSFLTTHSQSENSGGNVISKQENSMGSSVPAITVPPSSPSLFSSKLTVGAGNSEVKIEKNVTNNDGFYRFGADDSNNQKNHGICGSNSIKIGYLINGIGSFSGNNKDNYIIGSEGRDLICAKKGNDIVMALGGNDVVYSGQGDDTVYGGNGNNQIFGEDGDDNVVGGSGDDLLSGGNGNDHLAGIAGEDTMIGGAGANYFECGIGLDTIIDYNPKKGDVISNNCEIVNNIDQRQQ